MMLYELPLEELIRKASKIRYGNFGRTVHFRVAHNYFPHERCTSDCKFCAWCRQADLDYAKQAGLLSEIENGLSTKSFLASARFAKSLGADLELISNMERMEERLLDDLRKLPGVIEQDIPIGIQPGLIRDQNLMHELYSAGYCWYDNDIETAPSYFPLVCSTHTLEEKEQSMRLAKIAQCSVWTGICIGIGETEAQRIEAIQKIQKLDVDGVTIHFFYSVPGIPLHGQVLTLSAEDILKTIAVARILLPEKPIIIGTGRTSLLRSFQPRIYDAGATGIYLGMYMNHPRPSVQIDLNIVRDLKLEVRRA